MQVGRKIYYDVSTGNIILDTGEQFGSIVDTTVEQDISTFTVLSERNRSTFDVLKLPIGELSQNFAECNGYRVNPTTKTLEFSYPDPNAPTAPPVFQKPLTEQLKELNDQQAQLSEDFQGLTDYLAQTGVL